MNLNNCDREPIRIPGAIQPHGVLFSLDPSTLKILQTSENAIEFVGREATELNGESIASILSPKSFTALQVALREHDLKKANPLNLIVELPDGKGERQYDGIISSYKGSLILELEPSVNGSAVSFFSFYHSVRESVLHLQNARTIAEACNFAATELRRVSAFDRVTIYKFDEHWNGVVLAEDRAEYMESYLGQRFPASDIPAQARELYTLNWLRLIANVDYEPARLVPELDPRSGKPTDLSFSVLRSVSPVHLEYMRNMKMAASMSISIIKEDRLWGLISCHHRTPHYVSYQTRSACEFLGQIFSYQLSAIEARDQEVQRMGLRKVVSEVATLLDDTGDLFVEMLSQDSLLQVANASGVALVMPDEVHTRGRCPSLAEIQSLADWTKVNATNGVYVSHDLSNRFAEAKSYTGSVCGVLALTISRSPEIALLWFRPELIYTIDWAGNPNKPVSQDGSSLRLHPRKSFELWSETVRGQALPFTPIEIEVAKELRNLIMLKIMAKMNQDLNASNAELDSFTRIVAHDVKEPLRGMRNYNRFVLEDEGDTLSVDAKRRLSAAIDLGNDLENLLTELYEFSRLGRVDLAYSRISMQDVLDNVKNRLSVLIEETGTKISVPSRLPQVTCDRVRVGEIFSNLITNGIRYNDKSNKRIEITCEQAEDKSLVFCVRDNGIGIEERHFSVIFDMFRRLHTRNEYAGGTGAGLAIVKRIIQRHGGNIWLDSEVGKGSAFYFTLQSPEASVTI